MNREILFIADDFGLSREVNAAIVRAHREGALHGASLMMGQPGTDDAVALARATPTLQVGWHLHLCDSQPVTAPAWPWGRSHWRAGFAIAVSPGLMRREVRAQWELFRASGLRCAFVNSHHHLHAHPVVFAELLRVLPADFDGWIRRGWPCRFRRSDTLWGVRRTYRMDAGEVRAAMGRLPAGLHEFLFHPRGVEHDRDFAALMELKC